MLILFGAGEVGWRTLCEESYATAHAKRRKPNSGDQSPGLQVQPNV